MIIFKVTAMFDKLMILEKVAKLSIEEIIDLVKKVKVDEKIRRELLNALNYYDYLNPMQKRFLGGLLIDLKIYPRVIDFLGFGRDNVKIEGLYEVGDCTCIYSKGSLIMNIEKIGSSALAYSSNSAIINVRKADDFILASSNEGLAYKVGSIGRYAFFNANNVVAAVGRVEQIYDPKSGVIIASEIGEVIFEVNKPENVKIITTKVFRGKEYVTLVDKDKLEPINSLSWKSIEDLRRQIQKFASKILYN